MRGASETARSALNAIRRLWDEPGADSPGTRNALSSEDRGRYAVQFIKAEGYGFLGQFVLNAKGEVGWVQTERVLEGINSFFAGGVRELEARLRRDEAITAGDVGWATADVAIGVGALKVLRMGRTAGTGARAMSFSERSAALGAGLWRGSAIGAGLVKYGAPAVLAYVALRHPSVINSLIGSVAEKIGLRVELAQVLGWTMVLLPVLLLLRLLLGPLVWLLAAITALFRGLHGLLGDRSGRASYRGQ
jgi:hypothetical protein